MEYQQPSRSASYSTTGGWFYEVVYGEILMKVTSSHRNSHPKLTVSGGGACEKVGVKSGGIWGGRLGVQNDRNGVCYVCGKCGFIRLRWGVRRVKCA